MINLETVQREINEVEARGQTTYAVCERLAWLYIVRDHLQPGIGVSLRGSEFLEACDGAPYAAMMKVLDEHMTAMKLVNEREYESVLARIRALG